MNAVQSAFLQTELYICEKIIRAHGGEVGIENKRGGGTRMRFRLPAEGKENGK